MSRENKHDQGRLAPLLRRFRKSPGQPGARRFADARVRPIDEAIDDLDRARLNMPTKFF